MRPSKEMEVDSKMTGEEWSGRISFIRRNGAVNLAVSMSSSWYLRVYIHKLSNEIFTFEVNYFKPVQLLLTNSETKCI